MKKGVIMEINERFLTMLTPEGEFLRAKRQDLFYEIGQEIYFSPLQEVEKKKIWSFSIYSRLKGKSIAMMAMAAALIIAFVSFIPFNNQNQVYAYMSIDVNPSIELGVNDQLEVVELTGYNDSGKQVIKTIENWEEKSLNEVTGQILTVIKDQGYLEDQKDVVIGTVHTGEIIKSSEDKLDQSIKKLEETIKQDEVKIISVEATEKERQLAKESGKTVGQFVKEKTQKSKLDQSQSGKKQLPNQQKNNSKNQDKVEQNNDSIEKHPAGIIAPGQQKKIENQNKINEDKQKSNNVPPRKNEVEKKNNHKNSEKDRNNNNSKKDSNNGKNNNGETDRNNSKNNNQEKKKNDQNKKNDSSSDRNERENNKKE